MWIIAGSVFYLGVLLLLLQFLRIASKADNRMHHLSIKLNARIEDAGLEEAGLEDASHFNTTQKLKVG